MAKIDNVTASNYGSLGENPLLLQLIGLSPLLAVSYSLVNSLAMSIIFSLVLLLTTLLVSVSRHLISPIIALTFCVTISATLVTCMDFILQAWRPELRKELWIYLPIIAANCLIIDRSLAFAMHNPLGRTFYHALQNCLVVVAVLLLLGACRELIGTGSLFHNLQQLFKPGADMQTGATTVIDSTDKVSLEFTLATLPAGAFIFFGLLMALKQYIFPLKK